jgi:hypothetical protein
MKASSHVCRNLHSGSVGRFTVFRQSLAFPKVIGYTDDWHDQRRLRHRNVSAVFP